MAGDELAPPEGNEGARPREFDAAIRDLNACIERIHFLIPRVNAMIERRTNSARSEARPRVGYGAGQTATPRVVYGGGPTAFAPRHSSERVATGSSNRPLIVATDLALAGYSIEQIRTRVQDFDRLAVSNALEETFE
jgi:hypothetical protein